MSELYQNSFKPSETTTDPTRPSWPSGVVMTEQRGTEARCAVATGSPAVPVGVLENVAQVWRRRAEGLRNEAKTLKQNARWQGRKRRFLAAQLESLALELDLLIAAATVRQPQENGAAQPPARG